jgi:hypothetical protein
MLTWAAVVAVADDVEVHPAEAKLDPPPPPPDVPYAEAPAPPP